MATRQSLKGSSNKIYDVINNFNKGIDRRSADDVSVDSSFRELTNFYNEKEGVLSKRPGLYDSKFNDFIDYLDTCTWVNGIYNPKAPTTIVSTNPLDAYVSSKYLSSNATELDESHGRLHIFKELVLNGNPYFFAVNTFPIPYVVDNYDTDVSLEACETLAKNIVGTNFIKNDNFIKMLEKFDKNNPTSIFNNGDPVSNFEVNMNIVCSIDIAGKTDWDATTRQYVSTLFTDSGLLIFKLHIIFDRYNKSFIIETDLVHSSQNCGYTTDSEGSYIFKMRFLYGKHKELANELPLTSYNGYSYFSTGRDSVIQISDDFPDVRVKSKFTQTYTTKTEYNITKEIGGPFNRGLYMPSAVEASNIGFNILAQDPLGYVENSGTTDAIKGIFYTVNINDALGTYIGKEPISDIPANSPFNLHILQTGTGALAIPQYRPDNGDTNTTTNPYKNLNGAFSSSSPHIFECTGLNGNGKYEIKTTKGTVTFLSYISTGMNYNKEVGKVSDIKELVLSSKYCKVIGNQLVLYGGHKYIFFSEYDNFSYFPNYFYIYAANDIGEEEITSINYFRQYYAVFSNKKIRRMTGSFGSSDFGIYPLNDFVGCRNRETIKQVNNNLLFVADDGLYKLKQGYTGEGTENVEKIDFKLGESINSNTTKQAFVFGSYYILINATENKLIAYDFDKDSFYEFLLEGSTPRVYNNPNNNQNFDDNIFANAKSFNLAFHNNQFDEHGSFLIIPDYEYKFQIKYGPIDDEFNHLYYEYDNILYDVAPSYEMEVSRKVKFRILRLSSIDFLDNVEKYEDDLGYISTLETPNINMGTPTNTKKFKEIYVKMINKNTTPIPLYFTIYVDDIAYVSPEDYEVRYDATTNTYYYVYTTESNQTLEEGAEILEGQEVLGTLTLGEDTLGNKTIYQLKIKVNGKGRSIKIKLADGYDDTTSVAYYDEEHCLIYYPKIRNNKNFTITSIGIAYKLKKVKEG